MITSLKGDTPFNAGGVRHVLSFTIDSLIALEDRLDKPVMEIIAALANPAKVRLKTLRAMFWAGLIEHAPQTTDRMAGELMLAIDDGRTAHDLLVEAVSKAFPKPAPKGEGDKGPPDQAAMAA